MDTLKASDLRIGNSVLHKLIICTVLEISNEWVQLTNDQLNTRISEVKPIPLTEEWLLNLGFEQNGDISYKLRKTGFVILVFGGIFKHNVTGKKFKYVHKLQNFYYELKDEELILKK